jgi:hypothetical protein
VLRSTLGGPHLPPSPLPLPRCGRGRGGSRPHTFALASVRSPTRSGRGDHAPAPSPSPLSIPRCGSVAMAILRLHLATMPRLRTQSPLSRAAGEGLGVRAPPIPSPGPLPLLHGVKQGEVSVAMAILRLHLATMPRLRTQSPLSRSAGEGLGVRAPQDLAFSATGDRYPGSGTSTTTPSLMPTRSPGCAGRWLARAVNDWNPSGSASAPHYPRHLASTLPTSFRSREG